MSKIANARRLVDAAEARGLDPLEATWADINEHDAEIRRRELALARGLPEAATYAEINDYDAEQRRKK